MVRNMTKGSPVKLLLAFALPLLVANVFQQLYSVADAMVLGRGVGVNALAAAGSTGSVHFFIFGFINGLTHGYSILISQRFGAGDESGMRPHGDERGLPRLYERCGHHGVKSHFLAARS